MNNRTLEVAIIGGGQAGLSVSHSLLAQGVKNQLIFEKNRIAHSWREERWDSFCLVTPNFQCRLPGFQYDGKDPHGFMLKDEIVDFVERYAKSFNPPIIEGISVDAIIPNEDGFTLETTQGTWTAQQVVVAIGSYHKPRVLKGSEHIPLNITQLHSSRYKNPDQLPKGAVMIVGSAQSGCQIAEDFHLKGREVHLCLGGAPRSPRFYRGRDVVDWFEEMGHYSTPIDEFENPDEVRHETNHYLTGRDGGHELDLRQFAREGMHLHGFLESIDAQGFNLRADVKEKLDAADATYVRLCKRIDGYIEQQNLSAPPAPPAYTPVWEPETESTRLDFAQAGITSMIWATGFEYDFRFVQAPIFDDRGYPQHKRGVTDCQGLYFLGLPWLHTWGSGRFAGIREDANYVADHIVQHSSISV